VEGSPTGVVEKVEGCTFNRETYSGRSTTEESIMTELMGFDDTNAIASSTGIAMKRSCPKQVTGTSSAEVANDGSASSGDTSSTSTEDTTYRSPVSA